MKPESLWLTRMGEGGAEHTKYSWKMFMVYRDDNVNIVSLSFLPSAHRTIAAIIHHLQRCLTNTAIVSRAIPVTVRVGGAFLHSQNAVVDVWELIIDSWNQMHVEGMSHPALSLTSYVESVFWVICPPGPLWGRHQWVFEYSICVKCQAVMDTSAYLLQPHRIPSSTLHHQIVPTRRIKTLWMVCVVIICQDTI